MATPNENVRKVPKQLPSDRTVEDVRYRVHVVKTLRKRTDMAERREFADDGEVERRLSKWLDS